jgi:hypothetical protein
VDAFAIAARMYVKVVHDRSSPIPLLGGHGWRLPD